MLEANRHTNKNTVGKAGIGYTIGNYLIRGLGFITVPIFSRLLSTNDFGIYNTFLAYEAIVYIFISLALNSSIKNAKYRFDGHLDEYTSSVSIIPLALLGILLVTSLPLKNFWCQIFGLDYCSVVILFIYSYCSGLMIYYRARIGLDYEYKTYLKLSAFSAIGSILVSLVLIFTVFSEKRYYGRIVGGTLVQLVLAIFVLVSLFRKSKPHYSKEYWSFGLKISVPLIPHALSQIILVQFDKIMINKIIGSAEAGIYSFAYTIYSLVQITATSLENAFSPWAFQKMHERKIDDLKRISTGFMILIGGITTGVMLLAPELIYFLGGEKYQEAYLCTIPVLLAGFFAMSYMIPAVIEYFYEKTGYISGGTTLTAILNIIMNFIFIPKYGYVAAAYTTLVSYVLYFATHVVISRRLAGYFIINMKYLVATIGIVAVAAVVGLIFYNSFVIRICTFVVLLVFGIAMLKVLFGLNELLEIIGFRKNIR